MLGRAISKKEIEQKRLEEAMVKQQQQDATRLEAQLQQRKARRAERQQLAVQEENAYGNLSDW